MEKERDVAVDVLHNEGDEIVGDSGSGGVPHMRSKKKKKERTCRTGRKEGTTASISPVVVLRFSPP
jgi:hypothetical protein